MLVCVKLRSLYGVIAVVVFRISSGNPPSNLFAKIVQGESKTKKMKNYFWEDEVNKPCKGATYQPGSLGPGMRNSSNFRPARSAQYGNE